MSQLGVIFPISDVLPIGSNFGAGSGYETWGVKSHTGKGHTGFIVNSILGSDGSSPTVIWIGFNKQQPAPFNVGDAFEPEGGFTSIEFYNKSGVTQTLSVTLYEGQVSS